MISQQTHAPGPLIEQGKPRIHSCSCDCKLEYLAGLTKAVTEVFWRPLADPGRTVYSPTTTGLIDSQNQGGEKLLVMQTLAAGQPRVRCSPPFQQ